jgi:hypothetical protein
MQSLGTRANDYNRAVLTTLMLDIPPDVPVGKSADIYAEVVRQIGEGGVPVDLRMLSGRALPVHLDEMSDIIDDQKDNQIADRFARPDLVQYFREMATDPRTASLLGAALTNHALLAVPGLAAPPGSAANVPALGTLRGVVDLMGAVEDGFTEAGEEKSTNAAALKTGADAAVDALVSAGMALPVVTGAGTIYTVAGAAAAETVKTYGKQAAEAAIDRAMPTDEGAAREFRAQVHNRVTDALAEQLRPELANSTKMNTADVLDEFAERAAVQRATAIADRSFLEAEHATAEKQWWEIPK